MNNKDNDKPANETNSRNTDGSLKDTLSVAAAFCEWFVTLLMVAYMLTFVPEFRTIEFKRHIIDCLNDGIDNNKQKGNQKQEQIVHQNRGGGMVMSKSNLKTYMRYQTWQRNQSNDRSIIEDDDTQIMKCASSCRDMGNIMSPHDISFTLSTSHSSSYMSDSQTTNLSDLTEHQCQRHMLLEESMGKAREEVKFADTKKVPFSDECEVKGGKYNIGETTTILKPIEIS